MPEVLLLVDVFGEIREPRPWVQNMTMPGRFLPGFHFAFWLSPERR